MIHISNLAFILQSGELRCPAHPDHDPNYTPIGDESLIQKRGTKTVPLPPGGSFLNYISFYFGNRSPMLYKIQKENNEVPTIPQEEIIYLVTTVHNVTKHTDQFVFFDGHGFESDPLSNRGIADHQLRAGVKEMYD